MIRRRVVIIGAGPTGLAAAYKLTKKGDLDVVVLEKSFYVGGITATIRCKGVAVDLGPHRFTPHTKEVKKFVFDLLKGKVVVRKQKSHIYLWGKFLTYPLSMVEVLTKTNPLMLLRLGSSYLWFNLKNLFRPCRVASYQDYMNLNFGPFLAESIFCPIAEKTWGEEPSRLSVALAKQRVALENLFKTAVNVLLKRKPEAFKQQLTPSPDTFYYFKGGFGGLPGALAKEIQKAGGEIILGAEAKSIEIGDNRCRTVVYAEGGREHRLRCDWVIAANPVTQLIDMLVPRVAGGTIAKAKESLKFMNLLLFYLILDKSKINDDISMFFPDKKFPFGRIFEQKNYDSKMVPRGKTVLGVEITCKDSDEIWQAADKELAKTIGRQLERVGLIKQEEIADYFCLRFKNIYPVYDLQYKKNVGTLFGEIAKIENLIANGRLGLFMYNNTHHSLEMGFLAAGHIISGKKKSEKWEKDKKLFESYRIVE